MFDKVSRLHEAEVRVVSEKQSGLMNHKFALVDSRVVITGFFNWTVELWLSWGFDNKIMECTDFYSTV